jgi:hypothetical protein
VNYSLPLRAAIFFLKIIAKTLGGFDFFLYLCGGEKPLTDDQASRQHQQKNPASVFTDTGFTL